MSAQQCVINIEAATRQSASSSRVRTEFDSFSLIRQLDLSNRPHFMASLRTTLAGVLPKAFRKRIYSLLGAITPSRFLPERRVEHLVRKLTGSTVWQGPFSGMKYVPSAIGSAYLPKLLGTYELELHPLVQAIVSAKPDGVINIGAAEGYYAVGLARRMPSVNVLAFERNPCGQEAIRELARQNGIDSRVAIGGNCSASDLDAGLDGLSIPLIICDIEGGEEQLLDPQACPRLRHAYILVELHEFVVRGIGGIIRRRFAGSHEIEEIWERDRTAADFPLRSPYLSLIPNYALIDAMREWRPERMSWFWMSPRARMPPMRPA